MSSFSYISPNCNDTSIAIFKKGGNVLDIPYKKQDTEYCKGYNAAVRKCNKRAYRIMKAMMEAYSNALNEDDSD